MIFADSHLQSFHSLYSNCCEFAVTPSMLHVAKHATAAYHREHENKLSVSQQVVFCLLLYMGVLQQDPMPKMCFVMVLTSCKDFLQIVRIFGHDLTDMSCPRLTPLRNTVNILRTNNIDFIDVCPLTVLISTPSSMSGIVWTDD